MTKTIVLNPLQIELDFNNPRFSMFDFSNEQEIIKYLIDFEQIKELAFQIAENGYNTIGERIIVLASSESGENKYTVLEGNRRIASLKLLFQYSSLLKSSDRDKLKQLKLDPKNFEVSCDVVTEDTRDDALFKISAKHVDGIKTWSAIDKRVFYSNLYSQYRKNGLSSDESLDKIKLITPEGKVAIKNAIKQLTYLTSVYNATLLYKPDLEKLTHLDTDVLVSRVLRPLTQELDLQFDDEFQIIVKNKKVYEEILVLLGKSVWVDKTLDTRVFSVQGQWEDIVKANKVIPGLAEKIREYKGNQIILSEEYPQEKFSKATNIKGGSANEDIPTLSGNEEKDGSTYNAAGQIVEPKYKFFISDQSVTINQQNYDLTKHINLVDNKGNNVSRQSSEYSRILINCTHQNIVIKNNTIVPPSENGEYNIDVEYNEQIKHFKVFLNVAIKNKPQEYQVLFKQQWYDESLAKLSSNPTYSKICDTVISLQKYNTLSHDGGYFLIVAFLLRALLEYSTKAYIDLVSMKRTTDSLSSLVTAVKGKLSDKHLLNKEESKALKNTNDIEILNGLIHDYGTNISSIDIKSTCSKYEKYLSTIFNELFEGVNNG